MSTAVTIELTRDELRDPETGAITRPGNGQVFIEPLEESRRGRWRKNQHMPPEGRTDPRIAHAPEELPGYRVSLDIKAGSVRVFDPLRENEAAQRTSAIFRDRLGRRLDLERPIEHNDLSKQQLWSWARWMFRAVREGDAATIQGELPRNIAGRLKQEREWDLGANPNTGEKRWEAEPELAVA